MSSYRPITSDQVPQMAALIAESFNLPQPQSQTWIERSGVENWRALFDDQSGLVGGLMRIPMAQWFGGQAVSMTGLAGVAVSPVGRGKRQGQQLIRNCLEEMWEEGTALSALYCSTTSFYRRCGYERAGCRFTAEVPVRELPSRSGPLQVRALTAEDHPQVEELQARYVQHHGALVRGPYLWVRVRGPRGMVAQGYGFFRGEQLEGYTYLIKQSGASWQDNVLEATDLVLPTPDTVASFLGLLAGHRAFFPTARWPSPPNSPLLLALPEPWQLKLSLTEQWMLRIVRLRQALSQRGYPPLLQAQLHLQVEDPWFEENAGAWVLQVEQGTANLERGGEGQLRLDIGTLAALYSGFMSAEDLALAGRLSGDAETLATASAIFGGWTPMLADFF
jgi:predicted acetyltransferase